MLEMLAAFGGGKVSVRHGKRDFAQ